MRVGFAKRDVAQDAPTDPFISEQEKVVAAKLIYLII